MRYLHMISLRWALLAPVGLLAALLVTAMLWETFVVYLPDVREADRVEMANRLSDRLLDAMASQARERGFTASYLTKLKAGERDNTLLQRIRTQRSEARTAMSGALEVARRLVREERVGEAFRNHLETVREAREAVGPMRSRVEAGGVPPKAWFQSMTHLILSASQLRLAAFLPEGAVEAAHYSNNMVKQALWRAAEYAGRERAALGQAIGAGRPLREAERARLTGYRRIVDSQLEYLRDTAPELYAAQGSRAAEEYGRAWRRVEETFLGRFQDLRKRVYAAAETGDYPVGAGEWLDASTEGIDTLFALGKVVDGRTARHVAAASTSSHRTLWIGAAMTVGS
ncbi:MAG TPA: nitrate- and nitrite sensing domain-containing protein, partial [Gammaproteobacteria bacterium]|nr:nitrate- and nitrite sensing domain-containing protein [Gammaproteobacteria bacterium]